MTLSGKWTTIACIGWWIHNYIYSVQCIMLLPFTQNDYNSAAEKTNVYIIIIIQHFYYVALINILLFGHKMSILYIFNIINSHSIYFILYKLLNGSLWIYIYLRVFWITVYAIAFCTVIYILYNKCFICINYIINCYKSTFFIFLTDSWDLYINYIMYQLYRY